MTEGPLSRVKSVEQAVESLIFLEIILQTSKEDLSCTTANPYRGWGGVGGGWVGGSGGATSDSKWGKLKPSQPLPLRGACILVLEQGRNYQIQQTTNHEMTTYIKN